VWEGGDRKTKDKRKKTKGKRQKEKGKRKKEKDNTKASNPARLNDISAPE